MNTPLQKMVQKWFYGKEKDGIYCIDCGAEAKIFRDEISLRKFNISGLCQKCQDEVFKEEE